MGDTPSAVELTKGAQRVARCNGTSSTNLLDALSYDARIQVFQIRWLEAFEAGGCGNDDAVDRIVGLRVSLRNANTDFTNSYRASMWVMPRQ